MRRGKPGAAAARRRRAGGKLAVGRPSATAAEWDALKAAVMARSGGRCEISSHQHPAQDVHHVVPRSLGGPDVLDNLIAICRFHHDLVDVAFAKGRLVIAPLGEGRFAWQIVRKSAKWVDDPFTTMAAVAAQKIRAS